MSKSMPFKFELRSDPAPNVPLVSLRVVPEGRLEPCFSPKGSSGVGTNVLIPLKRPALKALPRNSPPLLKSPPELLKSVSGLL